MKTVLLVEHGGDIKEYALKKAKERGYRIILATSSYSEVFEKYINPEDLLITNTLNSQDLVLNTICFLSEKNLKVDAVGTFRENVVIQTADLAAALDLPGVGPGPARRSSQNKLLMRETLCRKNFAHQPQFKVVNIFSSDCERRMLEFPKPCVIKPLYGTASLGVKMITDNSNLKNDISEIIHTIQASSREAFAHFGGEMLIEEYVPGRVISIDGIVQNKEVHIIGSIEFMMGKEPYFVQESSFIPAKLNTDEKDQCERVTREIIESLGFETAGFHCELRLTEDGPFLLEIAARLPGAGIYSTYNKVLGIDLVGIMFDAWLGNLIPTKYTPQYINFHKNFQITTEISKDLAFLGDLEGLRQMPGIGHISQVAVVGQSISTDPAHPTILYDYSIHGESYNNILQSANDLEKSIKFKIE